MDGQPGCIGGLCHKPLIPEYPLCDTIWSNVFTLAGFAGSMMLEIQYFKAATTNIGAMTMRWMTMSFISPSHESALRYVIDG